MKTPCKDEQDGSDKEAEKEQSPDEKQHMEVDEKDL